MTHLSNISKSKTKLFFYLLDSTARKSIPFLILSFLISSLLDVVGVGLIGVFLAALTNPDYFFQKFPHLIFLIHGTTEKRLIFFSGLFVIVAFVIKAIIALNIQRKIILFCNSYSVRLKNRMMTAYQYAPYTYHLQKNSAHLIARIQDNLSNYVGNVLLSVLNLISNGLVACSILLFLSFLHPFLTISLIVMFFSVGLIFDLFVKRKLAAISKIVAVSNGEMNKCIHNALQGITEVRVLGKEDYFIKSLIKLASEYAHASSILVMMQQIPRFLIENMMAIFIIGLSLGGIVAGYKMSSVVAMVGMFAAGGARLLPTVTQIITTVNLIRGYSYHTQLVYEELYELDQLTIHTLSKNRTLTRQTEKFNFNSLQLQNVSFTYPKAIYSALVDVSINITKGQSVGFIGPSGAGKSTLINLLLGFLEPQEGFLLVNNEPVKNLRTWLNNFAYIPQVIFLLDDSLKRNIAFGIEDGNIDEQRLQNAIKMAQLSEVVEQLPLGVDTYIGENGICLSGGQRQRVALARAFYHERDIIIMDEATSALDNETEKEVINTIKRLKGNKTLIVIAHRLTTVEHCDVIYRLEKGRVTAIGSYQEVVGTVA